MMWEYTSQVGKIRHREINKLRGVNQRRIAKAIRRAVGMGLMPGTHAHPEVLEEYATYQRLRRLLKKSPTKFGGRT